MRGIDRIYMEILKLGLIKVLMAINNNGELYNNLEMKNWVIKVAVQGTAAFVIYNCFIAYKKEGKVREARQIREYIDLIILGRRHALVHNLKCLKKSRRS